MKIRGVNIDYYWGRMKKVKNHASRRGNMIPFLSDDTPNEILRFFMQLHFEQKVPKTKVRITATFSKHFFDLGGVNWPSRWGRVTT